MEIKSSLPMHLIVLMVLCILLFFSHLGSFSFFNKGEPREALVVQDIFLHGNWLFPLRAGSEVPSKPPLFHWLGALASLGWGAVTEFTVRFPSALFATLGVLAVYWFGRRFLDPGTGLWGAVILATSMGYQHLAISARVDMTLAFFLTVSLILFYSLYRGCLNFRLGYYLFYFVTGVSVLAKGPVSLILTGMIIVTFLGLRKRWDFLHRLCWDWGFLLALLIPLLWYGLAFIRGGEEFFNRQVMHENISRFFFHGQGGTGHQKPIYYYIPYLFSEGLPWSLFLPFVVAGWVRDRRSPSDVSLFLVVWVLIVFVFFSLSAGKRAPYILPLYPALSVLIATWFHTPMGIGKGEKIGLRLIGVGSFLIATAFLTFMLGALWGTDPTWLLSALAPALKPKDQANLLIIREAMTQAMVPVLLLMSLSLLLWASLSWNLWTLRTRPLLPRLALISVLSGVFAQATLIPSMAQAKSYGPFMEEVNRIVGGSPLYVVQGEFDVGPLFFYAGGKVAAVHRSPEGIMEDLRLTQNYFIMSEKDWVKLGTFGRTLPLPIIRSSGRGPDGNSRLVLLRGIHRGLAQ